MNRNKDSSTATPRQHNVVLKTPYGELRIDANEAHDHANMKAHQLKAFLTLISGDGQDRFSRLNGELQNSLLWMMSQAADQLDQLLSQVAFADVEVTK